MDAQAYPDHPQMKSAVVLRGTAKDGKPGPPVGVVDIGVAEKAYLFRVAVPGVDKESGIHHCFFFWPVFFVYACYVNIA